MAFSGKTRPLSIKFGLKMITGWLRASSTAYAEHCRGLGVRPADHFDPSFKSLDQLESTWRKAMRSLLVVDGPSSEERDAAHHKKVADELAAEAQKLGLGY